MPCIIGNDGRKKLKRKILLQLNPEMKKIDNPKKTNPIIFIISTSTLIKVSIK